MSAQTMSFVEIFKSGFWKGMDQFTDGTLQTDDGTIFRIHRVILSPRNEYFRGLFSFNDEKSFEIHNISSKMLESLLIYMYTGTITLDEKNVCDLMIACDYLLMDDLLKTCESFVIQNKTSTNCVKFLTIASQINRLAILNDCYRYALVFFEDILETPNSGLVDLPFEVFRKLLESNSLNAASERSVWRAIVSWTEASSTRLSHVPLLFTCLKLDEKVDGNLEEEILSHPIVNRNPYFFNLISSSQLDFHSLRRTILSQHASLDPLYQNFSYLYNPRMPNCLHLIARHELSTEYGSELFLSYDNELDFWRRIGEQDYNIEMMLRTGQHIYTVTSEILYSIFDVIEEVWLERYIARSPSHEAFRRGAAITLGEKLYEIELGPRSRNRISSYEFENNIWKNITTAHNFNIYGAVTLKDQIFIVGTSELNHHMVCLAYDPEKDSWNILPAPNVFRDNLFSLVAFHEQVFIIPGEKDDERYPKKVEKYDSLQNNWILLPDTPFEYLRPKAVVVDDKLIVYENKKKVNRYQELAPVYWDEGAQLWKIIRESSPWFNIERYSFLVLDDMRLVKDITVKHRCSENEWKRILDV